MATAYLGTFIHRIYRPDWHLDRICFCNFVGFFICFVVKGFDSGWHQLGRWAFYVHGVSNICAYKCFVLCDVPPFLPSMHVLTTFLDLPLRYILSAGKMVKRVFYGCFGMLVLGLFYYKT